MSQYFGGGGGGGGGNIIGPGSSTNNALVRWDGITGTMIKNGVAIETDAGEILAGNGSEALPAFSFVSSPGTGMYLDGANTLRWSTNGQNRLILGPGGTLTSFGGVNVSNGNLSFGEAFIVKSRSAPGDITVFLSDYIATITDTSSPRTATMPQFTNTNQVFIIKDGSGGALINNITVSAPGGVLIDGAASYVINTNWGSVQMYNDGTNYLTIAKS